MIVLEIFENYNLKLKIQIKYIFHNRYVKRIRNLLLEINMVLKI